ncbi:MAG: hypothetical protein KG003_15200 [Bacteroidetes bacterium]|nr:hypothetical protein [Bacteroidota bacterium]
MKSTLLKLYIVIALGCSSVIAKADFLLIVNPTGPMPSCTFNYTVWDANGVAIYSGNNFNPPPTTCISTSLTPSYITFSVGTCGSYTMNINSSVWACNPPDPCYGLKSNTWAQNGICSPNGDVLTINI